MQPQVPARPPRSAQRDDADDDGPPQAGRDDRRGRGASRASSRRSSSERTRFPTSPAASTVVPIWQSPFGAQTYWLPAIAMLGGMGLLILLVVCANVANLVLVRGVSRRGELACVWRSARAGGAAASAAGREPGAGRPWRPRRRGPRRVVLPFIGPARPARRRRSVYLDTSVDGYVLTFALGSPARARSSSASCRRSRPRASNCHADE